MAHTALTSVLAEAIFDKINDNKSTLGIRAVYYGNHNMVPDSPAAVVIPGRKNRSLAGVSAPGGRTMNELNVVVDILTQNVKDGESLARLEIDQLAESVETLLHQDTTMGGIIIHGYVTTWDPGVQFINSSQFRVVRMSYLGITKTYLST